MTTVPAATVARDRQSSGGSPVISLRSRAGRASPRPWWRPAASHQACLAWRGHRRAPGGRLHGLGSRDPGAGPAHRRLRLGTSAFCTNSGATWRPATTLTSPIRGIGRAAARSRRSSGLVRYATAKGHPATAASRVVVPLLHNAASAARSTTNDADGTTGYGHRTGSSWIPGAALTITWIRGTRRATSLRRRDECIEVPPDLLRPAAREKAPARDRPVRSPSVARAACAVRHRGRAIEQRMPDERGVDPVLAEERLLERQDHRGLGDDPRQLAEPVRAPRPDLRGDVVQHRDALGAGGRGEFHVEAGIVDADEQAPPSRSAAGSELPEQRVVPGNVPHDLHEPHHGRRLDVLEQLDTRRPHARRRRCPPWCRSGRSVSKRRGHPGGVEVARCFAGREQDVGHESRRGG